MKGLKKAAFEGSLTGDQIKGRNMRTLVKIVNYLNKKYIKDIDFISKDYCYGLISRRNYIEKVFLKSSKNIDTVEAVVLLYCMENKLEVTDVCIQLEELTK